MRKSLTNYRRPDIMKEVIEQMNKQNLTVTDYATIIKIIQASLQRGAIRAEECSTVGKIYEKLQFMIQKQNKENDNAGLSKTDN